MLEDLEDEKLTLEKIAALDSVKGISPVRLHSIDELVSTASVDSIPSGGGVTIQKRNDFQDSCSPHVMGGVDKLRAEGYYGDNTKIAIIDTGVDYKHPALGGCFGKGFKIYFGYDLVGDDFNGYNKPVPDSDPYDNCYGHGTHAADIMQQK